MNARQEPDMEKNSVDVIFLLFSFFVNSLFAIRFCVPHGRMFAVYSAVVVGFCFSSHAQAIVAPFFVRQTDRDGDDH